MTKRPARLFLPELGFFSPGSGLSAPFRRPPTPKTAHRSSRHPPTRPLLHVRSSPTGPANTPGPASLRPPCATRYGLLTAKPHQDLYDCFDEFEACLHRRRDVYRLPGDKARVYAYCNALGIETRENKRDYCDAKHWNLGQPTGASAAQAVSAVPCAMKAAPRLDFSTQPRDGPLVRRVGTSVHKE